MLFLIDENLPISFTEIFQDRGYSAESVRKLKQLQGQPDEVVFDYAVKNEAVIVTKDLGFGNPFRFELPKLKGLIILRFPNDLSIRMLKSEVKRLTEDLTDNDFQQLIIIEPGSIRSREL